MLRALCKWLTATVVSITGRCWRHCINIIVVCGVWSCAAAADLAAAAFAAAAAAAAAAAVLADAVTADVASAAGSLWSSEVYFYVLALCFYE